MATLPQLIEEDINEINRALQDLLLKSDASIALLIDKGGFLITQCGDYNAFDTVTLSALSAASFAATQGIAGLVNEINFSSVYQQGEGFSMLVLNVDEYSLLTVIFKSRTSGILLGMSSFGAASSCGTCVFRTVFPGITNRFRGLLTLGTTDHCMTCGKRTFTT